MPRVVITGRAALGLNRCGDFLLKKDTQAFGRASLSIIKHLEHLQTNPNMGRPRPGQSELRELIIPFGDSGYIALYSYDTDSETVYIHAFRHQRESDYS